MRNLCPETGHQGHSLSLQWLGQGAPGSSALAEARAVLDSEGSDLRV